MSAGGEADIQARVARIEGLIQAIEAGPDGPTRDAARELAGAVLGFHGAGLSRIWERLAEAGAPGRAVAEACARDDLVAALLSLHDLLPAADTAGLVQLRTSRDAPAPPPAPAPAPAPAPDLVFEPEGASAVADAATPLLSLAVRVRSGAPDRAVEGILLRCQVRIEPQRRGYGARESEALGDLFGDPSGHDHTLRPMLWTHTGAAVPAFTGEALVEMPLPCTYDLAMAPARYLDALEDGEAPLLLLFSGTVFWAREDGALRAEPIAWSKEARYGLPVRLFREAMDRCYAGSAPLLVRREVAARLRRLREARRFASWDEALESLLDAAGATG